jgi:hypothetical protein
MRRGNKLNTPRQLCVVIESCRPQFRRPIKHKEVIMSTNSTFEYTVNYGGTMDAYITLRNKIDSLAPIFEGLAANSNYDESTLNGIFFTLRDLRQHAAALELVLTEVFKQSNVHRLVG